MPKVSRVEYRIAWGAEEVREAAWTLGKEPGDGLLMLRCDSAEEAEDILAAVEKFRARKTAEVQAQKKPRASATATPPAVQQPVVTPSKLAPDKPVAGIKVDASVVRPTAGSTVGVAASVTATPAQSKLAEMAADATRARAEGATQQNPTAEIERPAQPPVEPVAPLNLPPTLKVVGSGPAVDPAAVGALVAKVRATIPAAALAEAQMKAILVTLMDAGVPKTDKALMTAVCEALRNDVPRLAKIARMEDRVDRTLLLFDAEADQQDAKGA